MVNQRKVKSKFRLGSLEIKKIPQGFLIENNGNTIELKDTETHYLKKALVHAIRERDFELLKNLLPGSFLTEENHPDENKKLKGKRIVFVSDLPKLSSKLKSILKNNPIIKTKYLQYDDKTIFDKDADIIVAHQNLPRKTFFLELNQFCLENNIKFIKTTFYYSKFIITPFLLPYESACYNCYVLLKTGNRVFDQDTLNPQDFIHTSNTKPTELMIQFYAHFLVVTLFKFLTPDRFFQEELSEIILDLMTFEIIKNPLLKVPFCPACSLHAKTMK